VSEVASSASKTNSKPTTKPRRVRTKTPAVEYVASFSPGPDIALPAGFAGPCKRLQDELGRPLWLLVQNTYDRDDPLSDLGEGVRDAFFRRRSDLRANTGPALLIDSPGGYAGSAYEIARLFQRHCGSYVPVVPRYAKSAATLLALGGPILMGEDAELGPLDAQLFDYEREEIVSALNEVQALERLHLQAVDEVDHMVPLLVSRTRKKYATILPLVLEFVAAMKGPLLEKIDTVHYSQQARVLKEAEDYAVRLLERSGIYAPESRETTDIPARLVNRYPDHSFVIDREEAAQFLRLMDPPSGEVTEVLSELADYLTDNQLVAIGRFDAKTTT
jgi:hypothetical protein